MYKASTFILSLGLSMSLSAFGYQQPGSADSTHSQGTDTKTKKGDMGSRNRMPDSSGAMVGSADQQFMMNAAKGGMMEVQMGQSAEQKASSQAVKDFGKKMAQDHGQANKELMDLAKNKNVSLPADMGTSEKNMTDKVSGMSGAGFDKAYMKMMVRDHKKDIKEFEHEASNGMDSDVKAWAAKTLPTLREHLSMVENIEKNMGKGGTSGAMTGSSSSGTAKQ